MKSYEVNGDNYFTICSVHNKILNIFQDLKKINPDDFKTPNELYEKIMEEIQFGPEFVEVALKMGQSMEDALKYKSAITAGTMDFYNFCNYMKLDINEEED